MRLSWEFFFFYVVFFLPGSSSSLLLCTSVRGNLMRDQG